jgi:hypothetical protein
LHDVLGYACLLSISLGPMHLPEGAMDSWLGSSLQNDQRLMPNWQVIPKMPIKKRQ